MPTLQKGKRRELTKQVGDASTYVEEGEDETRQTGVVLDDDGDHGDPNSRERQREGCRSKERERQSVIVRSASQGRRTSKTHAEDDEDRRVRPCKAPQEDAGQGGAEHGQRDHRSKREAVRQSSQDEQTGYGRRCWPHKRATISVENKKIVVERNEPFMMASKAVPSGLELTS